METIDSVGSPLWEFKGISDYSDKKFMMSTPFPVIFVLIMYLWFILKFGPEFMKNRKPYKLDRALAIYNLIQVLLSCYIVGLIFRVIPLREAINVGWNNPKCFNQIRPLQYVDSIHCYFIAKIVELLDTVFFVLRKKQRQVSFLHVYHHTTMACFTWCVVKYSASDSLLFIGMINSAVHIIMYSYYGLSVFPALTRYLWWKKYITIMQLVQFCVIFVNIVLTHFVSDCQKSYILLSAVCYNTTVFFYLFGDFYIKSYNKERKTNTDNDNVKLTEVTANTDVKSGLNYLMNHRKLTASIN